ncbi:hypothetical protein J0S82_002872, partial [Galemys pyrenaicus]
PCYHHTPHLPQPTPVTFTATERIKALGPGLCRHNQALITGNPAKEQQSEREGGRRNKYYRPWWKSSVPFTPQGPPCNYQQDDKIVRVGKRMRAWHAPEGWAHQCWLMQVTFPIHYLLRPFGLDHNIPPSCAGRHVGANSQGAEEQRPTMKKTRKSDCETPGQQPGQHRYRHNATHRSRHPENPKPLDGKKTKKKQILSSPEAE